MKRNFIYSFFIALACLGFVACDSDDNDQTKNLPEGSKPSTKFTVGNCEDEQNAKDAIKLDVKTWGDGKTDMAIPRKKIGVCGTLQYPLGTGRPICDGESER